MARILGTGNATLDIVLTVDGYPQENDEIRCTDRFVRRGGNTANTLVVLSQLGHACSWAGTLVDSAEGKFIRDDLETRGVDTAATRLAGSGSVPVSSILLNAGTGSRTIIHFRDLPEYSFADFSSLELQSFDWLHFEGRNVESLQAMLHWSRERYPYIPCSLEIEKPRPGIEDLFGLAQVLLFSQTYAAKPWVCGSRRPVAVSSPGIPRRRPLLYLGCGGCCKPGQGRAVCARGGPCTAQGRRYAGRRRYLQCRRHRRLSCAAGYRHDTASGMCDGRQEMWPGRV